MLKASRLRDSLGHVIELAHELVHPEFPQVLVACEFYLFSLGLGKEEMAHRLLILFSLLVFW